MTADEYVASILAKYEIDRSPQSLSELAAISIEPTIRRWAGSWLDELFHCGSSAKGTGTRGVANVDIFIALKADMPRLNEVYEDLFSLAETQLWSPKRRDVSVGISYGGVPVDLIPGWVLTGSVDYYSLYWRKTGLWRETNVKSHIDTVSASSRSREIRAIKIWRHLKKLDFPTLYLELFVIDTLSGRPTDTLADNVHYALYSIGQFIEKLRIVDPANRTNVLSEDLTVMEKKLIASAASASASQESWADVIW
jgi:hypothetical protein